MKPAIIRSAHWPAKRKEHLAAHPVCEACGGNISLEVHHKLPVHLYPTFELADQNLITLCEGARECHLNIGHCGNWHTFNPLVELASAANQKNINL